MDVICGGRKKPEHRTPKRCNKCGRIFPSYGPLNRICDSCKEKARRTVQGATVVDERKEGIPLR